MGYVHGVQGGEPWKPASARGEWLKGHRSTWPTGGQGEGAVPFPTELPPQSDKSPRGCVGAEREEERGFRWILVKRTAEALARGMSFSHL